MTILTALVALFFLAMGLYALAVPARVLAIFGVDVTTVDGRNEVRAVYGGFGIAVSLVLLATLAVAEIQPGVLVALSVALLGMAAGRLIAALIDRSPGFYPWFFFATELVLASALAGAWLLLPS